MTGAAVTGQVGPVIAIPAVVTGCLVLYFVCVTHGLQAFRTRTPLGTSVREIFGGRRRLGRLRPTRSVRR